MPPLRGVHAHSRPVTGDGDDRDDRDDRDNRDERVDERIDQATPGTPSVAFESPAKNFGMPEQLFAYIVDHIREPDDLTELRQVTLERYPKAPTMAVGPDQGAFLGWLVETMGATRAIEVGVFTGYSSVCIGLAVQRNADRLLPSKRDRGTLLALDRDEQTLEIASRYWDRFGLTGTVQALRGDGMESLEGVLAREGEGTFDFAFVDANKRGYMAYYELLLRLVRVGGVIALDNTLWYGKVADEAVTDKTTESLRVLNRFLRDDDRVSMSLLAIGDGITLCTKR